MPLRETHARVDADLAVGRVPVARQQWRMKTLAWQGQEAEAATAFAQGQPVAVRTACADASGHPVDWDDPASYRDGLDGRYEVPSEAWTVGGVPAGAGCLVAALAFLAIWGNGLVARGRGKPI
ncbi:DUF6584 family protein [Streptomyces sp. NPDC013313]|uniref:DUF6584 family protein n=1 Tax=Streptomyces sp. NPDC013313 TaxID=3155603 RepID=UPI0033D29BCC